MRDAIVITPYDRPHYFQPMLTSLCQNSESQSIDFFFYIDGDLNNTKVNESYEICQNSNIKNKHITVRGKQLGPCQNILQAIRETFNKGYDRIIFCEDDIVSSPYYITLSHRLNDWSDLYNNVGYTLCHSICHLDSLTKKSKLQIVAPTFGHMVNFCLKKSVWDKIKDELEFYEKEFMYDGPYSHIIHINQIRQWLWELLKQKNIIQSTLFVQEIPRVFLDITQFATSWDFVTNCILWTKGYYNLATIVNHALMQGNIGFHFNQDFWEKFGYDKMKLDVFTETQYLAKFKLIYDLPKDTLL